MIKVTGGAKKRYKIKVPSSARPLAWRVRQHIFDYLGEYIKNAKVLDLYAGSGIFGIEALSRGAAFVYFVETNRAAIKVIQKNLEKTGFLSQAKIVRTDAISFLNTIIKTNALKFDIIFIDPPYKMLFRKTPEQRKRYLRSLLYRSALVLGEKALIIIKLHKQFRVELPESLGLFNSYRQGINRIYYLLQRKYVLPEYQGNLKPNI